MYAIESKENFELELRALLAKIDDAIVSTRSTIGTNQGLPSNSATSKINRLKMQEYKLKEISLSLVNVDQAGWEEKKEGFQKEFLLAKEQVTSRDSVE